MFACGQFGLDTLAVSSGHSSRTCASSRCFSRFVGRAEPPPPLSQEGRRRHESVDADVLCQLRHHHDDDVAPRRRGPAGVQRMRPVLQTAPGEFTGSLSRRFAFTLFAGGATAPAAAALAASTRPEVHELRHHGDDGVATQPRRQDRVQCMWSLLQTV